MSEQLLHPDLRKRSALNRICIWTGCIIPVVAIVAGLSEGWNAIEFVVNLVGTGIIGAFFVWAGLCVPSHVPDQQLVSFKIKANELFHSSTPQERNIIVKMLDCGNMRLPIVIVLPETDSEAAVAFTYALGDSILWVPPTGRLTALTRIDASHSVAIFELFGHRMWCQAPTEVIQQRIAHDLKVLAKTGAEQKNRK